MANNTLIASDNFVSGSLAAGWTAFATGFGTVVAGSPNVVEPTAGASRWGQRWTGNNFPTDHISEITINAFTVEAATGLGLYVRNDGANYYVANFSNGQVNIQKN